MRIIDAHTHIFPSKIATKAAKSIGDFYNVPMYTDAYSERLIEEENKIGVERCLVCSSAVTPDQVVSINSFISSECSKNSMFFGFAAMHPDFDDFENELDRALELGLRGVKFHPDFQKFDIDDEKAIPMYRAIAKRNLPVLFHTGDNRYDYSNPSRVVNLISKVPDLIAICAHFGGYRKWDVVLNMPLLENIYFDTSSTLTFLPLERANQLIERFGHEKFFFGTDFPMWSPEKELKRFMTLNLTDSQREDVLYNNFAGLFNL